MSEQENAGARARPEEEIEGEGPVVEPFADAEVEETEEDVEGATAPAGEGEGPTSGEVQALRDRHLRLAAEFDNYRKRVERERSESWVRAQSQLLERLLEPLDDLDRITGQDPDSTSVAALHEGASMVGKKFMRVLESAGVEEIDAADRPFDPTIHEALTIVPTADAAEDDTVAQVYQKGYRLKGVLIRPARVVVRKFQG